MTEQSPVPADGADNSVPDGDPHNMSAEPASFPPTTPFPSGDGPDGLALFGATAPGTAPAPRPRRTGRAVGVGVGYVLLAVAAAFTVITVASPAPVDSAAVASELEASAAAAPAPSTPASGGGSAAPSAKATTASASPSPSPSPTSTVHGTVHGGVHSGDLRFFLLPPPQGPSSVQGDPDGDVMTKSAVEHEYGGGSSVGSALSELHYKKAVTRTYQDTTLGANVTVELIQFGSASDASDWAQGFSMSGKRFSIPGESGASGYSSSSDGAYALNGTYSEGDTFYQISVFGTQSLPHSDLTSLMKAEHSLLASG